MTEKSAGNPERVLSFTDHLQELRVRIIICIVFFIVALVVSFMFAPRVVTFLMRPLVTMPRQADRGVLTLNLKHDGSMSWFVAQPGQSDSDLKPLKGNDQSSSASLQNLSTNSIRVFLEGAENPVEIGPRTRAQLSYLTPMEPFFLWMQGALLLSGVVAIPMLIYQFWLFLAPGLMRRERRIIGPLLTFAIVLFPIGAMFAYVILQVTLQVLFSFGDSIPGLEPNLVAGKYVSFALMMMISFGVVFEFPLVLVLLGRLHIIDSSFLVKKRKMAAVVMSVVAAFATPSTDPFSMVVMWIPLLLLYEGAIWAMRLIEKGDRTSDEAEIISDSIAG
jgi:sec-independent protein translocase protein TatC